MGCRRANLLATVQVLDKNNLHRSINGGGGGGGGRGGKEKKKKGGKGCVFRGEERTPPLPITAIRYKQFCACHSVNCLQPPLSFCDVSIGWK